MSTLTFAKWRLSTPPGSVQTLKHGVSLTDIARLALELQRVGERETVPLHDAKLRGLYVRTLHACRSPKKRSVSIQTFYPHPLSLKRLSSSLYT